MPHDFGGPERPRVSRAELDEASLLQRDANERLVLTTLQAHRDTDAALAERGDAEERAQELRDTAKFRERLIGIVGHDLRGPLNTVILAAGLQLTRGELGEADQKLATQVVTSGRRMARMLEQLVQFTRARIGGGFLLNLGACDLGQVCHGIAEELRVGSSSAIEQNVSGDLQGTWDADRVAEALSNLAHNALDHASPGTPVVIEARGEGHAVLVSVTNRGEVVSPALLPVIFEAFRGVQEGGRAQRDHLGLGLYIASEIVKAHGGALEVASADGTTTFTMRLPRAANAATLP